MNRKSILVIVILAVIIVAIIASVVLQNNKGEENSQGVAQERTVVINYNPDNYASAVFQIAKEEGLMEKYMPEGVKVEWTTLSSASDIRDAMVSGEIDIGTPGIMAYMTAIDNGMPLTLMSFYGYATVMAYTNQDDINSLADFKAGDQISISGLASNPQAAYLAALKEEGLNVQEYNTMLVKIPNTEAISMLETKNQIKGSILSFSANLKADALSDKGVKKIRDFSDVIEKYSIGTALIANTDFYNENQDICDAVRKVQNEVIANWEKDMDKNAQLLAKQYDCDVEDVIDLMKNQPPTDKVTGYNDLAQLLYDVDMLSKPLKLEDLPNYDSIPR